MPGSVWTARSRFISPKAEFTPRNVQTAEERTKLVYRIKVTADNRDGVLKPGMPVEAEIAAMSDDAITFERVTKVYGQLRALDDLVVGDRVVARCSGSSARTVPARRPRFGSRAACCGPDSARRQVLGRSPTEEHRAITAAVGYLSQRFSLYGDLTIDENIAFFAEIHGIRAIRRERDRLLAMTQLTPFRRRRADKLSGGMKQKLALACTLVHEPEVLLLDEPTTGVDPVSRREFWKLLSEFLSQRLTIVMATPYLDEAERCARVALLHEGRLMAIDAPAALQANLRGTLFEVLAEAAASARRRAGNAFPASPMCRCSAIARTSGLPTARPRRRPRLLLTDSTVRDAGDERATHSRVARRRVHRSRLRARRTGGGERMKSAESTGVTSF